MSFEKPSALANSIVAGIYDILTNGDDTVPKSEDNFFSWCSVGIPLRPEDFDFLSQGLTGTVTKEAVQEILSGENPPELTPELIDQLRAADTSRLYTQAESFARMVDFVPDVAGTNNQFAQMSVMNNEGSLSDRYEYIMDMTQVMHNELPDDVKAKIKRLRGLLTTTKIEKELDLETATFIEKEVTDDSPMVKIYHEKLAAYEAAALEYNARRIKALAATSPEDVHYWSLNANILRNRVRAAMADWVSNGYKNDYEKIHAFIDQVMRRDMSLLKEQYRDDLLKAKLTGIASGSDFYYTTLVPSNFTKSAGWTEYGFRSSEYRRYRNSSYNSKYASTRGGGGFSLGLFNVGGGGSGSSSSRDYESHVSFDTSNFRLSFKIAQVFISQPWLSTAFLTSKCIRMDQNNPQAKSEMISDGGTPPKGKIPAYPTSMLVIKDLELHLGQSKGFSDYISQSESSRAKGGGFLSFGPFNLGGSHSRGSSSGETTSEHGYEYDGKSMKVPGMQIIGFKCHVLPKSPDPLPEITDWI
ncbi:MAG: hypothetical protein F6K00_11290 [Leptolyngbya sp. SIOISBB]|nr:hypothetical protein [Leptolyngbya sp. SIOISBB]